MSGRRGLLSWWGLTLPGERRELREVAPKRRGRGRCVTQSAASGRSSGRPRRRRSLRPRTRGVGPPPFQVQAPHHHCLPQDGSGQAHKGSPPRPELVARGPGAPGSSELLQVVLGFALHAWAGGAAPPIGERGSAAPADAVGTSVGEGWAETAAEARWEMMSKGQRTVRTRKSRLVSRQTIMKKHDRARRTSRFFLG